MTKLFKSIADYFPNVIFWLDAHRIYGAFIFIVSAMALILSAYSVNGVQELKDKTDARLASIQESISELHEMSIENTAKLNVLIELNKAR